MDARQYGAARRRIISPALRALAATALPALLVACAHGPASPDFTLVDGHDAPWTLSAQRGHVVLLDFGFTHCADTCPLTLAKLVRVVRSLGPQQNDVKIAFVTVDPARDTPRVMGSYVAKFETTGLLAGLTGSPAQIAGVERAYHVWAQRVPGRRGSRDYDVAHSAAIYFLDRSGVQRAVDDDGDSEAALGTTLREVL